MIKMVLNILFFKLNWLYKKNYIEYMVLLKINKIVLRLFIICRNLCVVINGFDVLYCYMNYWNVVFGI